MPKINELPRATALTGTDLLAMDNSSGTATKSVSGDQIKDYVTADVAADVADLKNALSLKAWDIGSYNRFNKDTVTTDQIISKTGAISSAAGWALSDYVPVDAGMVLYAYNNSAGAFCLYDINGNVVSTSSTPNWNNPFTVPDDVSYIRMSFSTGQYFAESYLGTVNYFDVYKSIQSYTHDNIDRIDDKISSVIKKTLDFSVSGLLNKDYGTVAEIATYACTPLIPLVGVVYYLEYRVKSYNNTAICCFYDSTENFISSIATDSASLIEVTGKINSYPQNAAYVRFCTNIQNGYTPFIGVHRIGDSFLHGEYLNLENISFTKHDPTTNLIDVNKLKLGYINGNTDGSVHSSTTMYVTDYIPLKPGTEYYFNDYYLFRGYCAFYKADKTYISGYAGSGSDLLPSPFVPPANTAYGRFTIVSQNNIANAWLCETNQMAIKPTNYADTIPTKFVSEKPTEYTGSEITVFTKILCIGDSLTDGAFNESGGSRLIMRDRAYPAKLQALTGVETTNLGYAGYTSVEWYTAYQNEDLSGHDACIIQLGVNDALNSVSTADTTTAFQNIIAKVKTDNPGIKIFISTILPANSYMTAAMRTMSETIRTIVDNLNDDDVYLVDLWTYGHTDDYLAYDAGHLSALGYLRLAEDYKAYISYIIHNNINNFRYVQFIGTNYTYSGATTTRAIVYT